MQERNQLAHAKRVVVKIGSRVLVQRSGRLDLRRMAELVKDVTTLHRQGREVVVVSSGAIACGLQILGIRKRPEDLPTLQMAAAVGQLRLMAAYDKLFSPKKCRIGQVLLTHDDLEHRRRHLNARNSILKLLENRVIPIVNENDAVAVDEIKFGDNDALASRTAMLVQADLLVLLTTVNGFRTTDANGRVRKVNTLPCITKDVLSHATGKGSPFSTGGMASKLTSAAEAARMGTPVVIAGGRQNGVLQKIAAGGHTGTYIPPLAPTGCSKTALNHRRRWVAFFHHAQGSISIDEGACQALLCKGKSLLPVGVREIIGTFSPGDLIEIFNLEGQRIAQGLSSYSSAELRLLKGLKTAKIRELLGTEAPDEVIHRDNLVIPTDSPTGPSAATTIS
ncbi:MAG: glutamate 5-kinase [Verrucomicrobiota bacterium]|jgi:glutamate 5-kinase|nr:glutamate 5-kinase [Verrucomicrobiota bacterium]